MSNSNIVWKKPRHTNFFVSLTQYQHRAVEDDHNDATQGGVMHTNYERTTGLVDDSLLNW